MAIKTIQKLKGFRDFYPEDATFQNWFYENAKQVSKLYGYQEYEGPTVELLDLYAAKSGEELVKKQAFTFEDKSGKQVALRPEMTPTLARMVAQKSGELVFPLRWFTLGRRFRYEQPQKGRGREFFQWDIDILGSVSPIADAEIITIAANFYKQIGLSSSEVKIKVNDRKFLQEHLKKIGVKDSGIIDLYKSIDKKSKLSSGEFVKLLKDSGLNETQIKRLTSLFNDKDYYKDSEWLTEIYNFVDKQGFSDYVEFDASIARGLDYYTRTVFEGWDTKGNFRSIWGGGRYDNLVSDVGSKARVPGVGFAMGDMVLKELLSDYQKTPTLNPLSSKVLVTIFTPKQLDVSIQISDLLRKAGINTELYPVPNAKLQKQLKYADKKGIPWAVIIGPEEILKGSVVLKDMKSKKQETIPTQSLLTRIK